MTDRELLEAAAKAVGYEATPHPERDGLLLSQQDEATWWHWNPLADDGDALRLAVKLDILVAPAMGVTLAGPEMGKGEVMELHGSDPYAATRRAIVRAAAAMATK